MIPVAAAELTAGMCVHMDGQVSRITAVAPGWWGMVHVWFEDLPDAQWKPDSVVYREPAFEDR